MLTGNLGIALVQKGFSVCLLDADIAMANLSLLLGMQSSPITLHDVLLGEASVNDAIYDGPGGVKFIPSGLSLENYRRVDPERLEAIVDSIANKFDFILLDSPAGIEKNAVASIGASDEVLLIATPDPPSIADALKTKIVSQRLNKKVVGIVLNFVRQEKGEIQDVEVSKMMELPIYGLVPYDQEVRYSFQQEKSGPVVLRDPKNQASLAIQKVAAKLTGVDTNITLPGSKKGFIARLLDMLFGRK